MNQPRERGDAEWQMTSFTEACHCKWEIATRSLSLSVHCVGSDHNADVAERAQVPP